MKSVEDFFNAFAVVFGFSTDSATPAEVHTAFLESEAKAADNVVKLTAATAEIATLKAEIEGLKSGDAQMRSKLDAANLTIVAQDEKIKKLAAAPVNKTGKTTDTIALKEEGQKEYSDAQAPKF
jgi:hypothetical protein